MSSGESDSEYNSSDEDLQEAFAKGLLKPGLNAVLETTKKDRKNNVGVMKRKLNEMKLQLPWIERLDLVSAPAPLAPELALQMQDQELRRAKQLKGNKKLPQFTPAEDPVLNDFRRETMFHRQAQSAVIDGIARIKKLGILTIRPDDYFAEMAKTDDHMHKVRENLMKKQVAAQRSERVRQLRQQRKVGKQMQIEATLKKHAEKRKMLEEVKKYRKGIRQDLDFLDDKKKPAGGKKFDGKTGDKRNLAKMKMKSSKYGFGGKKKGMKQNTRDSAADVSEYRRPGKFGKSGRDGNAGRGGKPGRGGNPGKGGNARGSKPGGKMAGSQRPGKNRRVQMKSKRN